MEIPCQGFIPFDTEIADAKYIWYKEECTGQQSENNKVAEYDNQMQTLKTYHDLKNRATVDNQTGALVIRNTVVTDDHKYTCFLTGFVTMTDFKKEIILNITGSVIFH